MSSILRRMASVALLATLFVPSFLAAQALPAEVKFGLYASLTGDASVYGLSIKNGLELAVEEINAQAYLGKTKLKLVTLDEKADKQEGISVLTKLINNEKVTAVLGPTLSSVAFAADPIAQKAGVPVLATSNTANGFTDMGDYIFRDSIAQAAVVPQTVAAVKAKYGAKKAVLLFESTNEYSKSESEVMKEALKANGIELLATESYSHGDTDFRTQLSKLKLRKPDILVISALAGEAVPILQQIQEIGFKAPVVGGNGFNSPTVVATAKEAAEGVIVGASWFIESPVAKSQAFVAAYKKKYNASPDQFAAQAYAAGYLLADAVKKAGTDNRKAVRDALASLKDVDTVLGKFSFSEKRDPLHPTVSLIVKSGKFTVLQ